MWERERESERSGLDLCGYMLRQTWVPEISGSQMWQTFKFLHNLESPTQSKWILLCTKPILLTLTHWTFFPFGFYSSFLSLEQHYCYILSLWLEFYRNKWAANHSSEAVCAGGLFSTTWPTEMKPHGLFLGHRPPFRKHSLKKKVSTFSQPPGLHYLLASLHNGS